MYPQSMFLAKVRKIVKFSDKKFNFYSSKNICLLHGQVFIMNPLFLILLYMPSFLARLSFEHVYESS